MGGRMVHQPHTHTRPPLFSAAFNSAGSVWACDCGRRWTLVSRDGVKTWHEGTASPGPKYTDDLEGALQFIRDDANRHRRELGLPVRPYARSETP